MSCTNKVKQLVLAAHNHHDTHGYLPTINNQHPNKEKYAVALYPFFSWVGPLLPFLEQTALHSSWSTCDYDYPDFSSVDIGLGTMTGSDGVTFNTVDDRYAYKTTPIASLFCPSDGGANQSCSWQGQYCKNSYSVSVGDSYLDTSNYRTSKRSPFGQDALTSLGYSRITRGMESITDGTSNTVAFSETVTAIEQVDLRVKAGIIRVPDPMSNSGSPTTWAPISCLNTRSTSDPNFYDTGLTTLPKGYNVWNSTNYSTTFHTILPPNSPSCRDTSNYFLVSATSNHSGGVVAGFCDGSVRFVSETIDCGDLNLPTVTDGPSNYGVWGAVGSTNGGETKSLQ
jgi:prepilin-type processing-associated H-X9-DG protein